MGFFSDEMINKAKRKEKIKISELWADMKKISKTDFPNHKYTDRDIKRFFIDELKIRGEYDLLP